MEEKAVDPVDSIYLSGAAVKARILARTEFPSDRTVQIEKTLETLDEYIEVIAKSYRLDKNDTIEKLRKKLSEE